MSGSGRLATLGIRATGKGASLWITFATHSRGSAYVILSLSPLSFVFRHTVDPPDNKTTKYQQRTISTVLAMQCIKTKKVCSRLIMALPPLFLSFSMPLSFRIQPALDGCYNVFSLFNCSPTLSFYGLFYLFGFDISSPYPEDAPRHQDVIIEEGLDFVDLPYPMLTVEFQGCSSKSDALLHFTVHSATLFPP